MIKEQSYIEKFALLEPWMDQIFIVIKKELRSEHLRRNPQFVAKHFSKKLFDKITAEEMKVAYLKEISEGNEEIGELVMTRWMFKHTEIYQFFAATLSKINPDFEQIEEIAEEAARPLMEAALKHFGAATTYIFSVFNTVSFPPQIYAALRELAAQEVVSEEKEEEVLSVEALTAKFEKEQIKLTEKYEKKLLGMQRKYLDDMEGFKKQISQLQRRLQDAGR